MDVRATAEFRLWLDGLKDTAARSRILVRIDRLAHGNPGRWRSLGSAISELKIDIGPGYRVYFVRSRSELVLLAGGDKSSQRRDIILARRLLRELEE